MKHIVHDAHKQGGQLAFDRDRQGAALSYFMCGPGAGLILQFLQQEQGHLIMCRRSLLGWGNG